MRNYTFFREKKYTGLPILSQQFFPRSTRVSKAYQNKAFETTQMPKEDPIFASQGNRIC